MGRRGWWLLGFSHLPGPGPASSKTRGPLVLIAVRPKACPSCQPAYGPLVILDPRPGRPPAKPAPPIAGGGPHRHHLPAQDRRQLGMDSGLGNDQHS